MLDISPPILTIEHPHTSEQRLHEKYSIVWVQYMLLDENQIEKLDEKPYLGNLKGPSTFGDWGHWKVGGERLQCRELARAGRHHPGDPKYHDVSFCFEPLWSIHQGPQSPMKGVKKGGTQWRQVDFNTVYYHHERLRSFVETYEGKPRPGLPEKFVIVKSWTECPYEKVWARPSAVELEAAEPKSSGTLMPWWVRQGFGRDHGQYRAAVFFSGHKAFRIGDSRAQIELVQFRR